MPISGPVIYLDDDEEDKQLFKEAFDSLGIENELICFDGCQELLNYLRTTTGRPFLIISDINLPIMSGLQLWAKICKDEYLRRKSVPFIFLSTSDDKQAVNKAYEMLVQGYFQKQNSFDGIRSMIKQIVDYWKACKHPDLKDV